MFPAPALPFFAGIPEDKKLARLSRYGYPFVCAIFLLLLIEVMR